MDNIHFIGIGGIGMSALARICLDLKMKVSGSDRSLNLYVEELKRRGATIYEGHEERRLSVDTAVVYSSAIGEDNPELKAARNKKLTLLHRSELLSQLMAGHRTLAVTGTHGKTTVTSLLTSVFIEAGKDPSFALGGILKREKTNGRAGGGEYFIAEADESDGTFLKYHPFGAIVTNLEKEHLDFFKEEKHIFSAFSLFLDQVTSKNHLFYCIDDLALKEIVKEGVSYGFSNHAALRIDRFQQIGWNTHFDLTFEGKNYKNILLSLLGKHNVLNAAAVFGLSLRLGVEEEIIRKAFENFQGVKRRCEIKGEAQSVLVIDDYAHHPTEVKVTLKAIRKAVSPRRLIAVFQPHRYSRTKDQLDLYGKAFEYADQVFVTDIYAAGEKPIEALSKETLIAKIKETSTVPVDALASLEELLAILRPHDVVVTLGAGDITSFAEKLAVQLENFPLKKYTVGIVKGGKSCEHEISLRSAKLVQECLSPAFYEQKHFFIDKIGHWHLGENPTDRLLSPSILEEMSQCDLFFPIMHGPLCEDGTLQGFFEILNKPYVGPDFRGCAVSMNKVLSKLLVSQAGVPTAASLSFDVAEWRENREELKEKIAREVGYPLFLKPVHLGSTIGVSRVASEKEIDAAAENAFFYDTTLMVEKSMEGCRELEFPVMGNEFDEIDVQPPGEIFPNEMAYDYAGKYGANPIRKEVRADLSHELLQKGLEMAYKAYRACLCTGMARADFFLDGEGNYWFLEINPIPGMTAKSLFPRIFKNKLGSFESLFDRLVLYALQRERKKSRHMKLG